MYSITKTVSAVFIVLAATWSTSALAQSAKGTWITPKGTFHIKIKSCGSALCGNLVWLKEPNDKSGKPKKDDKNPNAALRNKPLLGTRVILNMKPDGKNFWKGQVYKADEGRIYTGKMQLINANKLKLSGCVLGGVICKSQTMRRVN